MENEITFGAFPFMETPRFRLRQLEPKDAEAMFRNYSDEELMKHYGSDPINEIETVRKMIQEKEAAFRESRSIRWAIARREDDLLLGTIGFHTWSKSMFRAEIGYEISRDCWRQGILSEVAPYALRFGFQHMQLNRVEAQISPANTASKKLLEKLGFQLDGVLREHYLVRGEFEDTAIYSLLKREFDTNP